MAVFVIARIMNLCASTPYSPNKSGLAASVVKVFDVEVSIFTLNSPNKTSSGAVEK